MAWKNRILPIVLLLFAALFLLWAFLPRPVPVETAKVARGPLSVVVEEEGKTRLRDRFVVSAPVSGYVERVDLEVGDPVKKGQPVAALEPLRADALDPRSRAAAQARVAAAEAALEAAEARAREAAAADDYAGELLRRTRRLAEAGLATRDTLDRVDSEARRAAAAKASAEAAAEAARHEVAQARAMLIRGGKGAGPGGEKVVVRSPATGRVMAVARESEGVVAAGTPLMVVGDPARIEVEVDVLSADAVRIAEGTPVRFKRWGGDGVLEGRVRRVEPTGFTKISALGVEEQRVFVIVDFTSPREIWERIGDGYRLVAGFVLWEEKDVLQVPEGAVFRKGDRHAVYAVAGGRAKVREVTIGKRNGFAAQVLSGLTEGETVVVHPGDSVSDGRKVAPR
ncbi:MAG: HlyD family efflux transporter periplasmic adaptor subunit [Thermodesulfobacteriota bacterium]